MSQSEEIQMLSATGTSMERDGSALSIPGSSSPLAHIPQGAQSALARMFGNPYLLEKAERVELVNQLRECVSLNPEVSEMRVLLGMALCVNLEVEDAMEELNEAVRLSPNSYIAQLKAGELWMRLRVMGKAEEHTQRAAHLAQSPAQSELARRQAATIRTMKREGIERGGYKGPWTIAVRIGRRLWRRGPAAEASAALEVSQGFTGE
jgi:tetratricopeptide (TPR) repeat protein